MTIEFKMAFPHEIHIIPTINGGVIARCGCAELTFTSTNKLLTAMREYFADPAAVEKAYNDARAAAGRLHEAPMTEGPRAARALGRGRTLSDHPVSDGEQVSLIGPDQERAERSQDEAEDEQTNEREPSGALS